MSFRQFGRKNYAATQNTQNTQNIVKSIATPTNVVSIMPAVVENNSYIYNDIIGNHTFKGDLIFSDNLFVSKNSYLNSIHTSTINNLTVGSGNFNISTNIALGYQVLQNNTIGFECVAVGYKALYSNVSGIYNTSIGYDAAYHTNGDRNTSVGWKSLFENTTGSDNTSFGAKSLHSVITGSYNVGFGVNSMDLNKNGSGNTAIGYSAGIYDTVGNYNTYLGYNTGTHDSNAGYHHSTAIGYEAKIGDSNQIVLGTSTETVYLPGGYMGIGIFTPTSKNALDVVGNVVIDSSSSSNLPLKLLGGKSNNNISFGLNVKAGSFCPLTYTSDNIIYWSDNFSFNNNSGLVIAPFTTSNSGIRISQYGLSINTPNNISHENALYVNGSANITSDILINGLTLGRGNSNVSTNTVIGYEALQNNTEGSTNVAIGYKALHSNISGSFNTSIGYSAGNNVISGNYNTYLGYNTGISNSNAMYHNSTAIGHEAKIGGSNQIVLGTSTETVYLPGGYMGIGIFTPTSKNALDVVGNVVIDCKAASNFPLKLLGGNSNNNISFGLNVKGGSYSPLTYTSDNIIYWSDSFAFNNNSGLVISPFTTSNSGIRISQYGLSINTPNNISQDNALYVTGRANITSDILINGLTIGKGNSISNILTNTVVGYEALQSNKGGTTNVAIGYKALNSNVFGSFNTAIGYEVLQNNITGNNNTAIGNQALYSNKTGINNTSIGYYASCYTNGNNNTSIGWNALKSNTTGSSNTSLGEQSLNSLITGNYNVGTGALTLNANIIGSYNTAIGYYAGINDISGNYNTYLGYKTGTSNAIIGYHHSTAIGFESNISGSNQIVLGTSTESVYLPGGYMGINVFTPTSGNALDVNGNVTATSFTATSFTAISDYRITKDITQVDKLFVVDNLNPVTYKNTKTEKQDIGLIAHEVQEVYPFLVTGLKDGENLQSVNYTGLICILIKEIQGLKKEVSLMNQQITQLQNK
jgi:hypothetical protein